MRCDGIHKAFYSQIQRCSPTDLRPWSPAHTHLGSNLVFIRARGTSRARQRKSIAMGHAMSDLWDTTRRMPKHLLAGASVLSCLTYVRLVYLSRNGSPIHTANVAALTAANSAHTMSISIDFVKMDWCSASVAHLSCEKQYGEMAKALNATGSCTFDQNARDALAQLRLYIFFFYLFTDRTLLLHLFT